MADSNDWGEVIMGNSPLVEYLKELEKTSDIDVAPILSQQIMPNDNMGSLADELNFSTKENNLNGPATNNSTPCTTTNNTIKTNNIIFIVQRLLSSMYHKTYFSIVGSDLLHPEESIYLSEDDGTCELNIKPGMDADNISWSFDWRLLSSRIPQTRKLISIISFSVILVALFVESPLQTIALLFIYSIIFFLFLGAGLYGFVRWVQNRQSSIDNKIVEAIELMMKAIMEVELIARGYRLSSPLSPIERLEQSAKSRKSVHMRVKASSSVIHSQLILSSTSSSFLPLLPSLVSPSYTAKLSSKESAPLTDEPTLADLKTTYYQYFLDRSQFFTIMLLSLLNVTSVHNDSLDYLSLWNSIKELLAWQTKVGNSLSSLLIHLQNDVVELKNCVRTEFWANQIPKRVLLNKTQKTVQERFFQQSKETKLILQGIIERVTLCEENINNSDNKQDIDASKAALSELVEHYQIVRRDLAQSLELWDSGNILLLKIIDGVSNDGDDQQLKDLRNLVKDGPVIEPSEEAAAVIALELQPVEPSEEQTFEAYTGPKIGSDGEDDDEPPPPPPLVQSFVPGVPPPPPPMGLKMVSKKKPKKNRAERMAEKSSKPVEPSIGITLPPEIEAKRMINELKDVLRIRKPSKP